MTRKEINEILKNERGIILIEKDSEMTFLEVILSNYVSFISAFYFLKSKKLDILILTQHRMTLLIRNRVIIDRIFMGITNLEYNGIKYLIKVTDQNQDFSFPLNQLRINYEEAQEIKKKLTEFTRTLTT